VHEIWGQTGEIRDDNHGITHQGTGTFREASDRVVEFWDFALAVSDEKWTLLQTWVKKEMIFIKCIKCGVKHAAKSRLKGKTLDQHTPTVQPNHSNHCSNSDCSIWNKPNNRE